MALELHIAGPGVDVARALLQGDPELVVGRDAECGVCLPDPSRNVSRRHLALWNEADELHFQVLSEVNGVEMPFGEAPPGARGVLAAGQTLKLAEYSLTVNILTPAVEPQPDPWAVFDQQVTPGVTTITSVEVPRLSAAPPVGPPEDDPFGDWGFETTFGTGAASGGPLDASKLGQATDLSSFFQGLGVDSASLGALTRGELEAIGALVRVAVVGLFGLQRAASGVNEDLRAGDRTLVASKLRNPLVTDWPDDAKVQYLFGPRAQNAGFDRPERALRELLAELLGHELARGEATRAAVEGVVGEFSPSALKARLLGRGGKLFEGARAWEAYSRYYAEQCKDLPQWVQRLLDTHFTEAYLREILRIKRETVARQH